MNYDKIVSLVYEARNTISSVSLNPHEKNKNPYDFVTAADIGISEFLNKKLNELYPDIGFMTEEESEHTLSEKCFLLDPIDGTTNLIYDYKMSSVSLAYVEKGEVVFGVVFNPFTDEMFFAIKGKGAYLYKTDKGIEDLLKTGVNNYDKNILHVSNRDLKHSLIEFGAGSSHKSESKETFERARRVFENCLDLRRICSTAIVLCYISCGRLDGYFEKVIKPWDYAAGILILSEAGGKSSDWKGNRLPLDKSGTIVCANAQIFDELRNMVNGD